MKRSRHEEKQTQREADTNRNRHKQKQAQTEREKIELQPDRNKLIAPFKHPPQMTNMQLQAMPCPLTHELTTRGETNPFTLDGTS